MALQPGASESRGMPALSGATCIRCGGRSRVIEDDGHDVCWVCVVAWGRYASLATGVDTEDAAEMTDRTVEATTPEPSAGRDPTVTALLHWSHRTRVSTCPLCLAPR